MYEGDLNIMTGERLRFRYEATKAPQYHCAGNAENMGVDGDVHYEWPGRFFSGRYCASNGSNCLNFNCSKYPSTYRTGGTDDCMIFAVGTHPYFWNFYRVYHLVTVAEPTVTLQVAPSGVLNCTGLNCTAVGTGTVTITPVVNSTKAYAIWRLLHNRGHVLQCQKWVHKQQGEEEWDECLKWITLPDDWYSYWDGHFSGGITSKQITCSAKTLPSWTVNVGSPSCKVPSTKVCKGKSPVIQAYNLAPGKDSTAVGRVRWTFPSNNRICTKAAGPNHACWNDPNATTNPTKQNIRLNNVTQSGTLRFYVQNASGTNTIASCSSSVQVIPGECNFNLNPASNLQLGDTVRLDMSKNDCVSGFKWYRISSFLDDNTTPYWSTTTSATSVARTLNNEGIHKFKVDAINSGGTVLANCGEREVTVRKLENDWWER